MNIACYYVIICISVLKKDGFGDSPSFGCIVAEEQSESKFCKFTSDNNKKQL